MNLAFNSDKVKEKTILFLNKVPGYKTLIGFANTTSYFFEDKLRPFTERFRATYAKATYHIQKIRLSLVQKWTALAKIMPENIEISFFMIYSLINWRSYLPSKLQEFFDKKVDWLETILLDYNHPLFIEIRLMAWKLAQPLKLKINIPIIPSSAYIVTAFFLVMTTSIPLPVITIGYMLGTAIYALNARSFQNSLSLKKSFLNAFSSIYSIISSDFIHCYIPLAGLSVLFPAAIPCVLGLHYDVFLCVAAYRSLMAFNAQYSMSGISTVKDDNHDPLIANTAPKTGIESAYRSFRDSFEKQKNEADRQIQNAPFLSTLWLKKYYSAYEMNYLETNKVDHYSYLIGFRIEDYFFINQSYKPIHIAMTIPLLLIDTCRIAFYKRQAICKDLCDSTNTIAETATASIQVTKDLFESFVPALCFAKNNASNAQKALQKRLVNN